MFHAQCSGSTALGDTTKTSLGAITVPQTVTTIIGVWAYAVGGPGNTTLENVTGIFEMESPDLNLAPMQFPLDCTTVLTSGVDSFSPRVWNCNIPVKGGAVITGYATLDLAQTLANTGRWGMIYA